jgi:hypothetical protein
LIKHFKTIKSTVTFIFDHIINPILQKQSYVTP